MGLDKMSPRVAQTWEPYYRGPRELWLRCEGSTLARLISSVHYYWPFARGQWRLVTTLAGIGSAAERLRDVPFRSGCGVGMHLDMGTPQFLHLSGRLPPEPMELAVMSRLVREGDTFVDVGTHYGLYIPHVLGRLGKAGRYIAIEPSFRNCEFIRKTFGPLDQNLTIRQFAVSDWEGIAYLHADSSPEAFITAEQDNGVAVEVKRLDTILKDVEVDRTLVIKVDTEGQEAAVVRGCTSLAAAKIKPIFMLEYLSAIHGQTRQQVIAAVQAVFGEDYCYWAIDPEKGKLMSFKLGEGVGDEVRNIIALHGQYQERLKLFVD